MDDLDRLHRELDHHERALDDKVERLVRSATLQTEALGKGFCPVDTGFLKNSIVSEFSRDPNGFTGETGPQAHYGHYVEHGTSRMAPQPYMNPATDIVEPQYYAAAAAIADPFGVEVRRIGNR